MSLQTCSLTFSVQKLLTASWASPLLSVLSYEKTSESLRLPRFVRFGSGHYTWPVAKKTFSFCASPPSFFSSTRTLLLRCHAGLLLRRTSPHGLNVASNPHFSSLRCRYRMEELGDFPGRLKKEEDAHAEVGPLHIARCDSEGWLMSPVMCHLSVTRDLHALLLCSALLLILPPPLHRYSIYIEVGLASVGNDPVKCANHSVRELGKQGTVFCFGFGFGGRHGWRSS